MASTLLTLRDLDILAALDRWYVAIAQQEFLVVHSGYPMGNQADSIPLFRR